MTDKPDQWRRLDAGASITRWAMAEPEESLYPGEPRPMPDTVDYRFFNGWVATGDLPCREALRAALEGRRVARPEGPFDHVFVAFDGHDVDFSQFCHRPTLIRRAFRVRLRAEAAGVMRFALATCGGVHVWRDTHHAAAFEPFHRNTPERTEFELRVEAGESDLTVRLEELHERDTMCFFSLTYLGGPAAAVALPEGLGSGGLGEDGLGGDGGAGADVSAVADILSDLRAEPIFLEGGTASLAAGEQLSAPVRLRVWPVTPFHRGGLQIAPATDRMTEITLSPDRPSAPLFESADVRAGCVSVKVSADCGGAVLTRQLGITNLPPATPLTGGLAERKARAADLIAASGVPEPSVAALLAIRGEGPEVVARTVDASLTTIEERHDCSDFTILPLLRLWRDARETLAADRQARLRAAVLGYRYWLDEPGNDVMWFWSENHVLCFHTAQAIAGGFFPEEVFANSGKTGAVLRAEAIERLDRWFDSVLEHGLCEWNSAAYYPIDLLALFTLHDMVPELRGRSASLLDLIFVMTGLHTSGGVPAGSQGRCYEKELLAGPVTELGSVAAIAFGGPFRSYYDRAAALFCLSDYEPPPEAGAFAAPTGEDQLEARYTQGLDHAGKLTLWKSPHGQLSTVTELDTQAIGHQAQVIDAQLSGHPMARLWINHPGDLQVWSTRRPSLLAGNHVIPQVAQYGPTALMVYDLDKPWTDLGFTQLFAPADAFSAVRQAGPWRLFEAGSGRIAVWCSLPLEEAAGPYHGSLSRAHGDRVGWVVALAMPSETGDGFEARLEACVPEFDADGLAVMARGHDGAALSLTNQGPLHIDGSPRPFGPLDTTPHVSRNGGPLAPWR